MIEGELFTLKEAQRLRTSRPEMYREVRQNGRKVEISKRRVYFLFGARFINTNKEEF